MTKATIPPPKPLHRATKAAIPAPATLKYTLSDDDFERLVDAKELIRFVNDGVNVAPAEVVILNQAGLGVFLANLEKTLKGVLDNCTANRLEEV